MSASGPFTVIQRRPVDAVDAGHPEAPKDGWIVYCETFATLEDDGVEPRGARTAVADLLAPMLASATAHERHRLFDAAHAIEPGRSLTLPNGDVIEVEATTWSDLVAATRRNAISAVYVVHQADEGDGDCQRSILAAWNAEHGIGIGEAS